MLPGLDLSLALAIVVGVLTISPGLLAARLLGLRGTAMLAMAGPVSIAVIGVAGVILQVAGIRFGPLALAGFWVIVLAAVVGIAWALRVRRHASPAEPIAPVVLAMVVAGLVLAFVAILPLPQPDAVSQSYDAVFHLNGAASILQYGDASSLHLYRLTNPGDDVEFYPAAWHSLVALIAEITGSGVPRATTAAWVATSAAIWVPGIVWLTEAAFGRRFARLPLLCAATLLSVAFVAFPYGLLDFGTLYPNGLAYALLPAGIAVVLVLRRRWAGWAGDGEAAPVDPVLLRPWLLALIWLVAEVFAHPRSLFGAALFIVPILVADGIGWARRRAREPGGRRRVAIGVTAVAGGSLLLLAGALVGALLYFEVGLRGISDRLNGGPALADQTLPEAVLQVLGAAPVVRSGIAVTPSIGIALLVLAGIVIAIRQGRTAWLVASFVAVAALFILASTSDSDLAKILTGAWYKDKFRLSALLPIASVPLAAGAVAWLLAAASRMRHRVLRLATPVLGALLATALAVPAFVGLNTSLVALFEIPETKDGHLVGDDLWTLLTVDVPRIVPEGERVMGNPWQGAVLTWVLSGREPVYAHLTGRWWADRNLVGESLDTAASNPEVCAALERLNAHYVVVDQGRLWGGGAQSSRFAGIDGVAEAPGFDEVAAVGTARLYRISACD
jgi:hypothetical protein